ncbi:hypothetical protein HK102_010915, partial [Quaeritorhiza haematococci]
PQQQDRRIVAVRRLEQAAVAAVRPGLAGGRGQRQRAGDRLRRAGASAEVVGRRLGVGSEARQVPPDELGGVEAESRDPAVRAQDQALPGHEQQGLRHPLDDSQGGFDRHRDF